MQPLILQRSLKIIEQIYDESMYGSTDIFRIKDLIHSLDPNQWRSKQWLAKTLGIHYGFPAGKILIVGGWYGLLGHVLRDEFPDSAMNIVSMDMDPRCEEIGYKLFYDRDIEFLTQDVSGLHDFKQYSAIISTSTEHLPRELVNQIVASKAPDAWIVLQSNNYFDHPSHINCVKSADELADSILPGLQGKWIAFKGDMDAALFRRFMVIAK